MAVGFCDTLLRFEQAWIFGVGYTKVHQYQQNSFENEKIDQCYMEKQFPLTMTDTSSNPTQPEIYYLTRGQLAGIDNLVRLLQMGILIGSVQRGARQSHETGPGRLEDAERSNELEERVYPGRLRGAIREFNEYESGLGRGGTSSLTPRQCSC